MQLWSIDFKCNGWLHVHNSHLPKGPRPTSDEDVRIHHIWIQVSINLKTSSILDMRAGQTLKEIRSDQRSEVIRREWQLEKKNYIETNPFLKSAAPKKTQNHHQSIRDLLGAGVWFAPFTQLRSRSSPQPPWLPNRPCEVIQWRPGLKGRTRSVSQSNKPYIKIKVRVSKSQSRAGRCWKGKTSLSSTLNILFNEARSKCSCVWSLDLHLTPSIKYSILHPFPQFPGTQLPSPDWGPCWKVQGQQALGGAIQWYDLWVDHVNDIQWLHQSRYFVIRKIRNLKP